MFIGEYSQALTANWRVVLPVAFREGETLFYVSTLNTKQLQIYPQLNLVEFNQKIAELSPLHMDVQDFARLWFSSLQLITLDLQGRFVLSKAMQENLSLEKNSSKITLIGVGDHLEVYQEEYWRLVKAGLVRTYPNLTERVAFMMDKLQSLKQQYSTIKDE